jgi:hypothetical protein
LIIGLKAPVHVRQDMKPSCPGSPLSSVERLSQANEFGRPDGIASLDETLRGRRVPSASSASDPAAAPVAGASGSSMAGFNPAAMRLKETAKVVTAPSGRAAVRARPRSARSGASSPRLGADRSSTVGPPVAAVSDDLVNAAGVQGADEARSPFGYRSRVQVDGVTRVPRELGRAPRVIERARAAIQCRVVIPASLRRHEPAVHRRVELRSRRFLRPGKRRS